MGKFPYGSKGFWGSIIVILAAIYTIYQGDTVNAASLFGIGLGMLGIRAKFED